MIDGPSLDGFLAYWSRIRGRTLRAARRVPAERLEWRWRDGAWSPGDLLRHLAAIERWMFAENAAGRPSRYPGHGEELAAGLEAVLAYLDRMDRETVEILRELGDEGLSETCTTPGGAELPVWKWLRAMVEHEAHHRGQLHLLLSMTGVAPPALYGLTEEEVAERSRPVR